MANIDFSVPFSLSNLPNIDHFVAREQELASIHNSLGADGSDRIVVLQGLGGVGKSQLAAAYAKQHKDSYSAIFWLNIKNEDALRQSFAKIARQILKEHPSATQLSNVDMEKLDDVIEAVKSWISLDNNTQWLMIYDDYDKPELPGNTDLAEIDIHKFLPRAGQGSIIITTRSSQVNIGHSINITTLQNVRDSLEILSSTSRREGLLNGENLADFMRMVLTILDSDATVLANELNGHPFALATAGAYLGQMAISLSDYLRLYKASWAKLQNSSPELTSSDDQILYSTFQVSLDHVEQQNGLSAKLLRLWAYFDNQDLWFELLQRSGDFEVPDWIQELTKDDSTFSNAVQVLSDHKLVEADTSSNEQDKPRGYSIHRCVHSWTIHILNQEWDPNLAKVAVQFVGSYDQGEGAVQPWATQQRLLQHAARCSFIVLKGLATENDIESACHNLGTLFASQGKLDTAEDMYKYALKAKEKACGLDHKSTLNTVDSLAVLYARQRNVGAAEEMYEQALRGYEKEYGLDHISTLGAADCLAILYAVQGKLDAAEKMHEQVLRGYEKEYGLDNASTLSAVHELSNFYIKQGKLDAAENVYKRVLESNEKEWGPDHVSTFDITNNLGTIYADQGKLDEAAEMFEKALRGKEKALGPDDESSLNTINNLARLYRAQGRLDAAAEMYERALRGKEKAWGIYHTSTLETIGSLGLVYADQGKQDAAEEMYMLALGGYTTTQTLDDTSSLATINNLGNLKRAQGKFEQAEEAYHQALRGKERTLGPDHPSTLDTVDNLGNLYLAHGKLEAAEDMYHRALAGYDKNFGLSHKSTIGTVASFGALYSFQGRLEEAENMLKLALAEYRKILDLSHPLVLSTINNLGVLYKTKGDVDGEAEINDLYDQAHSIGKYSNAAGA